MGLTKTSVSESCGTASERSCLDSKENITPSVCRRAVDLHVPHHIAKREAKEEKQAGEATYDQTTSTRSASFTLCFNQVQEQPARLLHNETDEKEREKGREKNGYITGWIHEDKNRRR